MSNTISFEVKGFADLDKFLTQLPIAVQHRVMTQVIAKGARHIRTEVRKAAPARTAPPGVSSGAFKHTAGHLRKGGIIMGRSPRKFRRSGVISLSVGFSKSGGYGGFIERGTEQRKTRKGYSRGKVTVAPFMLPAFDNSHRRAIDIMLTEGKLIIEKNIKKYIGLP